MNLSPLGVVRLKTNSKPCRNDVGIRVTDQYLYRESHCDDNAFLLILREIDKHLSTVLVIYR